MLTAAGGTLRAPPSGQLWVPNGTQKAPIFSETARVHQLIRGGKSLYNTDTSVKKNILEKGKF